MPFNFPIAQNRFGDLFAQGISNAINTYQGAKQQQRQNTLQDDAIAQNKSLFEYQHPGFHFTAPTDVLPVQQKVVETPGVQRTPVGNASDDSNFQRILGSAMSPKAEDRYGYGSGYYVDRSEEADDLRRKTALAGASEFQKALLTAAGTAAGNPAVTNYRNAQAAKLNYDVAHPKPLPPDPIAVHAANRNYDVAHPLPKTQTDHYTPLAGVDPTTNLPIVRPFDTSTGAVGAPLGINPKPAAGSALGNMQGARLKIAGSQATQADQYMSKYEDDLLGGRASIGANDLTQLKLASQEGSPVLSAQAEAWLNKHNPRLAQYFRAGKIMSSAERLVTPRGGSNALMGLEGMLSSVGPNPDAGLVQQVRGYRQGLVSGLTQESGTPTPTTKKKGAYDDLPARKP